MRKTLVAAAAFAVASGAMIGQAAAADLEYVPPPAYAPAPPPFVPTWSGFYVGGHIGYGEANGDIDQELDIFVENDPLIDTDDEEFFNSFSNSLSPNGLVGGVQGGYNWQMDSLVFGIEGDISFADWGQSSTAFESEDLDGILLTDEAVGTVSLDVDFLASVRGRLGFAMNSVLVYGTGGVAWADANARASVLVTEEDGTVLIDESSKSNFGDVGFVVGAGMAWMVIPQTFSVGLEGLYYFFDQDETLYDFEDVEFSEGEFASGRATASLDDAWVVRARADFHF